MAGACEAGESDGELSDASPRGPSPPPPPQMLGPRRQSSTSTTPPSSRNRTPTTEEYNTCLDQRPRRTSAKLSKKQEDKVLTGASTIQEKALALSESILKMLNPEPNERTAYADYTRQVMFELQPQLWRQFQKAQNNLIQDFLQRNDEIVPPASTRPSPPDKPVSDTSDSELNTDFPTSSHSMRKTYPADDEFAQRNAYTSDGCRPTTSSQHEQSEKCEQWQADPINWPDPTQVEQTDVWGSQDKDWYKQNMPEKTYHQLKTQTQSDRQKHTRNVQPFTGPTRDQFQQFQVQHQPSQFTVPHPPQQFQPQQFTNIPQQPTPQQFTQSPPRHLQPPVSHSMFSVPPASPAASAGSFNIGMLPSPSPSVALNSVSDVDSMANFNISSVLSQTGALSEKDNEDNKQ